MVESIISRVVERWRRDGIALWPGVDEQRVVSELAKLGRSVPRDVAALYGATGGFQDVADDEFWCLWSFDRMVAENAAYPGPNIAFADWAIDAWWYCLRPESEQVSSVFLDCFDGSKPRRVAASLVEFLSEYLRDPSYITDVAHLDWPNA